MRAIVLMVAFNHSDISCGEKRDFHLLVTAMQTDVCRKRIVGSLCSDASSIFLPPYAETVPSRTALSSGCD